MEASDATQAEPDAPAEGESADGTPVTVGTSGQEPLAASDQHNPNKEGPASAPDPRGLSGDPLDATTKAALGRPKGGAESSE